MPVTIYSQKIDPDGIAMPPSTRTGSLVLLSEYNPYVQDDMYVPELPQPEPAPWRQHQYYNGSPMAAGHILSMHSTVVALNAKRREALAEVDEAKFSYVGFNKTFRRQFHDYCATKDGSMPECVSSLELGSSQMRAFLLLRCFNRLFNPLIVMTFLPSILLQL